jgi:hypothetical protein
MASLHPSAARPDGGNTRRIAVLVLAMLQVLVPILPNLGIGTEIGERSDAVRTLITPAGWAFSIWGLLYAGSLTYAVFQMMPDQHRSRLLAQIGWPSAGAFLGNAVWALYTQSFGLTWVSAAIILFTLACLLVVYRAFALKREGFTPGELWLVVLPLSALAAWLTAASIVNIAASLKYHDVVLPLDAPLAAAGAVLVGGVIVAAALAKTAGNPWYALVFLWALAAIYVANGREEPLVGGATILAALLVAGTALLRLSQPENRDRWFHSARA